MKKIKIWIYGIAALVLGIAIGWVIKPQSQTITSAGSNVRQESTTQEWTCSMHPQIRQNEPGICPICEMDLVPVDTGLSGGDPTVLQMTEESVKLAQIETTIVGGEETDSNNEGQEILLDGAVEMDERTINAQASHLKGRIESLYVRFEGEYVSKGQKIGTIYSTDLLAASQELISAVKFEDKISGVKEAAEQKLKNWKLTQTQIDQIVTGGKPIETIDIYAEFSGYVLVKNKSQGDYVGQGEALYTLGSISKLWLVFDVYESQLSGIKKGQKINFTTPSTGAKEFNTKVSYINPMLHGTSRTAKVRANFVNNSKELKPGMLVKGKINILNSKDETGILAPLTSVLWTGDRSVVYVKIKDTAVPSFQYREVLLGATNGDKIEVLEGLELGEEIVVQGAFSVDASAQLSNKPSMMNKRVELKKENKEILPDLSDETAKAFKDKLSELATEYIYLKDALVLSDPEKTKEAAILVLGKLHEMDMTLLSVEAHQVWMEQQMIMQTHGQSLIDDIQLENQRKNFQFFSDAIIKSLKIFGNNSGELYVQHCPMADDNKGADWLSNEKQIRNPYFGSKMMKCGVIKYTY